MPQRKGLVNGIVLAGFGGGAFIFNQIQTAYVNPNNLVPDKEVDGDLYVRSVIESESTITYNVHFCIFLATFLLVRLELHRLFAAISRKKTLVIC